MATINKYMSTCYKCLKNIEINERYGLHARCFGEWFECNIDASFQKLTPRDVTSEGGRALSPTSFFHGKFKKYTAEIEGMKFVLKVAHDEYPHLPKVEFVSNQIAESLKLKIPNYYIIKLEDRDCFVSKHFLEGTHWQKLTHIYHYVQKEDEFDVETLKNIIFDITKKPQDVELFYQMLLFDALIGNHDRHGRNLGILSRGKARVLSPIYDNPSYIGVESLLGADLNPTGKIWTKTSRKPSMKDYVVELKRLKAERSLDVFKRRCSIGKILGIVQTSLLEDKVKNAMIRLVNKRYKEFYDTI